MTIKQPEMWTLGKGAGVLSAVAVAVLFAASFVICLVQGLGAASLTYTGLGTLLMAGFAVMQWRAGRRRERP